MQNCKNLQELGEGISHFVNDLYNNAIGIVSVCLNDESIVKVIAASFMEGKLFLQISVPKKLLEQ